MAQIDLHLHSEISADGELSVGALAERCHQAGVTLAALTDHNAVSGVTEFSWRCAQLGIHTVSGVELDCLLDGTNLHVLGYGISLSDERLVELEENVRNMQRLCAEQQMDAVERQGILFDREWVMRNSKRGVVTPELIAEAAMIEPCNREHRLISRMLPGGDLSAQPLLSFYWELCAPGKPASISMEYASAEQAIETIHHAGGIAVLAHPGAMMKGNQMLLDEVLELPLDGIEAFSSYHSPIEAAFFVREARKRGLMITGGSDFHGKIKPNIQIGTIDFMDMEDAVRTAILS